METTATTMTAATTLTTTNSNNSNNNNTNNNTNLTTIAEAFLRASATTSPVPPVQPPVLGMLVDRTSFDETDDYGVNRQALEKSSPVLAQHYQNLKVYPPPSTTVMKNGKVRRRMRWRPKHRPASLNNARDAGAAAGDGSNSGGGDARINALLSSLAGGGGGSRASPSHSLRNLGGGRNKNNKVSSSSNGSVVSHVSKESQKSHHSFASTETFKKNNTKKADFHARRYPLPRPNYPNTFDTGVSTISDEGNMVHAMRMKRASATATAGGVAARRGQRPTLVEPSNEAKRQPPPPPATPTTGSPQSSNQNGMMRPPLNPTSSTAAASSSKQLQLQLQQQQQQPQHSKMTSDGHPIRFHSFNNSSSTNSTRFQRNRSASSCSTLTSMNSTTPLLQHLHQSYPLRLGNPNDDTATVNTTRSRSSGSLYSGLTSNRSGSIIIAGGDDCDGAASVVTASTAPCRNYDISQSDQDGNDDDDANPLPALESEDLLCERRVDLRIPSSPAERRQTGNSSSRQQSFSSSSSRYSHSGDGSGGGDYSTSSVGGGYMPSPLSQLRSRGSELVSYKHQGNTKNHQYHHQNRNSDCHSTCSSVSVQELRPSSGASATESAAIAAASRAALEEELALDYDDPPTTVYNKNAPSPSSIISSRSKATTFSHSSKQRDTPGADCISSTASAASTPKTLNNSTFQVKREASSLTCSVFGNEDATSQIGVNGAEEGEDDNGSALSCLLDDESEEMPHQHAAVVHDHDAGEMRFCMSDIAGGGGGISRSYSEHPQLHQQPLRSNPGSLSPRSIASGDERTGPPPQLPPCHESKPTSMQSEKEHPSSPTPSVTAPVSPPPPGGDASPASKVNLANQNAAKGNPASSSSSTVPVDLDDGSFLDAEKNLMAIHEMAAEHLRHHEYSEALEVFEEILRGQLTRYGEDHFRVGTALHNIGIVHMKRGDYHEAVQVCREAVRIRRIALNPDHPDVAVSLAQLGVAYLECRKHKRAIVTFREALRIRRRNLGPKHPKVAKILNNIGCALYELNELEVAKVAFEEALEIQRETLRDMPFDDVDEVPDHSLLSIASTLSNIGSIKLYWGLFDEASIDLEEALLIQQSVLGDDHPLAQRTEESLDWIDTVKDSDQATGNGSNNSNGNDPAVEPPENDYYSSGLLMCASPIQVSNTEDAEQQQSVFPGMIICSPQVGLLRTDKAVSQAPNMENLNNDFCSSATPSTRLGRPALMCPPSSHTVVRKSEDERMRSILSVMERNLTKLRTGLGMESACTGSGSGGGGKDVAVSTRNINAVGEAVTHGRFIV